MSDLLALAERVEKATGPDRELDADICEAVLLPMCKEPDCLPDVMRSIIARTKGGPPWNQDPDVPFYTASLDAAMTLVPEDLSFEVRSSGIGDKGQATVWDPMRAPRAMEWRVTGCATPALALCAAALRAQGER